MITRIKPYNPSANELESNWHVIDAKDKVLGRLSSEAAMLIMGKHRPEYVPHLLSGDFVIIINAAKVRVTGNKADQIVYRRHSQKPGKLKEIPYRRVQAKAPTRIIEHAVRGMLPKNKLGERMIRRLKVYAGEEHPHESQLAWSAQRPERDAKAAIEAEELATKRAAARELAVARHQIAEDAAAKTAAADAATESAAVEETKAKKPATASKAKAEKTTAAAVTAPETTADSAEKPETKAKPAAKRRTAATKTTTAKTADAKTAKTATSKRKKADSGDDESAGAETKAAKPRAAAKKPAAKKASTAKKKPATAKKDE